MLKSWSNNYIDRLFVIMLIESNQIFTCKFKYFIFILALRVSQYTKNFEASTLRCNPCILKNAPELINRQNKKKERKKNYD